MTDLGQSWEKKTLIAYAMICSSCIYKVWFMGGPMYLW